MEPVIRGRPTSLDVHFPLVPDQNTLVCLVNISPPRPNFLPWLRRVFRQRLGIAAMRFAGSAVGIAFPVFQREEEQLAAFQASPIYVGSHTVRILPHHAGDNAFSFSYRHVVNLSLEKLPLELWNRRGVAASVAGFASILRVEHACLHGNEFSSIFVLVKVEALQHIPHHLAFHRLDGTGAYADVLINEIWDVARSLGAPSAPPQPSSVRLGGGGGDSGAGRTPPRTLPRQGHAHPRGSRPAPGGVYDEDDGMATKAYRAFLQPHIASVGDFMAMLKLSFKT
uniref:Uncharacterized protein n=1 Tax=Aegilops tauschii TaxID=37682 RepID=M8CP40_AEGTA